MSVSVLPAFRLSLIVEQDEDGSFYATSPELQGFLVHGENMNEGLCARAWGSKSTH